MDQVLFSEPSTKMKEQMEQIRAEEAKRIIKEQANDLEMKKSDNDNNSDSASDSGSSNSEIDDTSGSSILENVVTDEEQKFLEERLGKQ